MSKEMKMGVEQHELLSTAIQMAKNISRVQCLQKGGDPRDHWCSILVGELNRITEENAALREALRLKEAECESIALDKQRLMIDLSLCIEELKILANEHDDIDTNLFLIEKVEESLTELGGGDEK